MVTGLWLLSGPARRETIVNHVRRIGRRLASLTRRASFLFACHAAGPTLAVTAQPGPPRWITHPPLPVRARMVA